MWCLRFRGGNGSCESASYLRETATAHVHRDDGESRVPLVIALSRLDTELPAPV